MNILIFHTGLLDGNKENMYVFNLAKEIKREGHRAVILSQENRLIDECLVDRIYEYTYGNKFKRMTYKAPASSGGECILIKYAGDTPNFSKTSDLHSFNNQVYSALENILLEMDISLFISPAIFPESWIVEYIRKEVPHIRHTALIDNKSFYSCYRKNKNIKDFFSPVFLRANKLVFKNQLLFEDFLQEFPEYKYKIIEKAQIVNPAIDSDIFQPTLLEETDIVCENLKYKLSHKKRDYDFILDLIEEETISLFTYGDLSAAKGIPLLFFLFPFVLRNNPSCKLFISINEKDKKTLQMLLRDLANGNESSIRKNMEHFAQEFTDSGLKTNNYYQLFLENFEKDQFFSNYLSLAENMDQQVHLLDYLPHYILPDLIKLSDICVFPILNDNYFSASVLETLSTGKATIFPRNRAMEDVEETISDLYNKDFAMESYRHLSLNDSYIDDLVFNIELIIDFIKTQKESGSLDFFSDSLSHKIRWKYSWTKLFDEIFR